MHPPFIMLLHFTIIFCRAWFEGDSGPMVSTPWQHHIMAGFCACLPKSHSVTSGSQLEIEGAVTLWKLLRALFIAVLNVQT